jgi:hypothetical protein
VLLFPAARLECVAAAGGAQQLLDAVPGKLCQLDESQADNAQRNWQLQPCHTHYFLRLRHPALQMQLDVQVCARVDAREQTRVLLCRQRGLLWQSCHLP